MMFVKSSAEIEKGTLPEPEMFAEMNKYNDSLKQAGMLVDLDGLEASSKGARVVFGDGKTEVRKGPFADPGELVAGFWKITAKSLEEAIEWAKKAPFKDGIIEIRPIQEMSDFPPDVQEALKRE